MAGEMDKKKKKERLGRGKDEKGRKWRERWTKKKRRKTGEGGRMRRVEIGGRDGQKKRLGTGKDERGRKWRERWTEKKTGEGER